MNESSFWGNLKACDFLFSRGWKIKGIGVCPCNDDARCEIDIVACPHDGKVVFVEVFTHSSTKGHGERLTNLALERKNRLVKACRAWLEVNAWKGDYQVDAIHIYGTEDNLIGIDHLENVPLLKG